MAVKWYVDEGLAVLIAQWKREHPGAVVYTIGDASHASRTSEHNPEPAGSAPGADYGEVDAADFMIGNGVTKADLQDLRDQLVAHRDARLLYVIWDGHITSSVVAPWAERGYTGSDKHTDHVHVSANDAFDANTKPWTLEDDVARTLAWQSFTAKMPIHQKGDEDAGFPGYNRIKRAQLMLNYLDKSLPALDADGVYGARTAQKLAKVMLPTKTKTTTNGSKLGEPEYRVLFGIG